MVCERYKAVKEFKLKQPLLCLLTAGAELINTILLFVFISVAKKTAIAGSCDFKVTFFFVLLVVIDILFVLGSVAALVYQLVTKPEIINTVVEEVKKLLNYKAPSTMQQPVGQQPFAQPVQPVQQSQPVQQAQPVQTQEYKFCTKCGSKIVKEAMFCTSCGNKCE